MSSFTTFVDLLGASFGEIIEIHFIIGKMSFSVHTNVWCLLPDFLVTVHLSHCC